MRISVKGISEGLLMVIPEGDWDEIYHEIVATIEKNQAFFQGADLYIDANARDLRVKEIISIRDVFFTNGMKLTGVLNGSEKTLENAKSLGLLTSLPIKRKRRTQADVSTDKQMSEEKSVNGLNQAFIIKKNVRSGVVVKKDESIVVYGDVNPGAEIVSGNDVMVWGRIRGKVSAGQNGKPDSLICAMAIEDATLSIGDISNHFPKNKKNKRGIEPIVLKIKDGEISPIYS